MERGVVSISTVSILFLFAFLASDAKAGHYEEDWDSYGEKGTFIAPPVDSYYGYYPPQPARIYVNSGTNYKNDGYYPSQPSRTYTDYIRNDDRDGYYPPQPARIYIGDYGRDDDYYDYDDNNDRDNGYYPPQPARIYVGGYGRNDNYNSDYHDDNHDNNHGGDYNPPLQARTRVDNGRGGNGRGYHQPPPEGNHNNYRY